MSGALISGVPPVAWSKGKHVSPVLHHWRGTALGADVSLQIYHTDRAQADLILQNAVRLMGNMEDLFSLYRPGSLLNQLNATGRVEAPDPAFVDLLQLANRVSRLSEGAFDVTVQPLWQLYNSFFMGRTARGDSPSAADLKGARKLVGYEHLLIGPDKVSFDQPGMAATLNGIAQGYVTDRITAYLAEQGLTAVLVDMGEFRALGPQADQLPWRIGLADPFIPGNLADVLEITGGAVATSSGRGDVFDAQGQYHHLLDPHKGESSHRYASVTVTAPEAGWADALSTAFCALPKARIEQCLEACPGVRARLTYPDGRILWI